MVCKQLKQSLTNNDGQITRLNSDPYLEFVSKGLKSLKHGLYSKVRFSSCKGTPVAGKAHSYTGVVPGAGLRLDMESCGGRYMMSLNTTLSEILRKPIDLTPDNTLLYEVEDDNDSRLMSSVADALLDAGWFIICKGLAVKGDLAGILVGLGDNMFNSVVEIRSYFRSALSTPNQNPWPKGLPVFAGDLKKLMGWAGNDGGALCTNGLLRTHQNRGTAVRNGDVGVPTSEAELLELWKGLLTNAEYVAMRTSKGWVPYNFALNEDMKAKVKAVLGQARTTLLSRVNTASEEDLMLVPGIGPKVAKALIEERDKSPFESFVDMKSRMAGNSHAMKVVKSGSRAFEAIRYGFMHEGKQYLCAAFLDESQAKGRKTPLGDTLKYLGTQGNEFYGWAIALDAVKNSARISLGWQVTQLLDVNFIRYILGRDRIKTEEGEVLKSREGRELLEKLFERVLTQDNELILEAFKKLDREFDNGLSEAAMAVNLMKILGRRLNNRISSGFGAKAMSKYVQTIDLGSELIIDDIRRADRGNGYNHAFFGRTPNQGHETIRFVRSLDVRAAKHALKCFVNNDGNLPLALQALKETKSYTATSRFLQGLKESAALNRLDIVMVAMNVLAMLPAVYDGCIISDEKLQLLVCGDNDGDKNMVSYDPLLKKVAKYITHHHPSYVPAKEQSKLLNVDTFHPSVVEGNNWYKMYKGNKKSYKHIQRFLNASGASPGQDNVGGPTMIASAPLNFCRWEMVERDGKMVFTSVNPSGHKFMDYGYSMQQVGLDDAKCKRSTMSLWRWNDAVLSEDGPILPGKFVEGARYTVEGKREGAKVLLGANLTKEEAVKIADFDKGDKVIYHPNHYPIYGFDGTFSEYKSLGIEGWENCVEMVPLMNGNGILVKGRQGQWENGALFAWAAWNVNAFRCGMSHMTYDMAVGLSKHFESSNKVNWKGVADTLLTSEKIVDPEYTIDAKSLEENWVWPGDLKSYQKTSFLKTQSGKTPQKFREMRTMIRGIHKDVCESHNIDTELHPCTLIARSSIRDLLSDLAGDHLSPYSGWKASAIVRQMYWAYVAQATDSEKNKATSERKQNDSVESGSDQKRFLRAALSTSRFLELTDGERFPYLFSWSKKWKNALSVRVLSDEDKLEALFGMMVLGLQALVHDTDEKSDEKLLEGAKNIFALKHDPSWLVKMRDIEMQRKYREEHFSDAAFTRRKDTEGLTMPDLILQRETFDSICSLVSLDTVQIYMDNTDAKEWTERGIYLAAGEQSEDFTSAVQDFIVTDLFGALEEAFLDIGRSGRRDDCTQTVLKYLGEVYYNTTLEGDEKVAQRLLVQEAEGFVSAKAEEAGVVMRGEGFSAWFKANSKEINEEFNSFINPLMQSARLTKHTKMCIQAEAKATPAHFMYNAEEAYGKLIDTALWAVDEETEERILRPTVEFGINPRCKVELIGALLANGHNVEFLTKVPSMSIDWEAETYQDMIRMKPGYIYLDAHFFKRAESILSREDMDEYLYSQLDCGIGHVTTNDHLYLGYGWFCPNRWPKERIEKYLGEDAGIHYHNNTTVQRVQAEFMKMYSNIICLSLSPNDHLAAETESWTAEDRDYYLKKDIFMPYLYGGKGKGNTLYNGEVFSAETPYKLYRYFGFVMAGCSDSQQGYAPKEVSEWMMEQWGMTVGAAQRSQYERDKTRNLTRHSAARRAPYREEREKHRKTNVSKASMANYDFDDLGLFAFEEIQTQLKDSDSSFMYLPSPLEATRVVLEQLRNLTPKAQAEAWKAFGHLLRLSPAMLFCFETFGNKAGSSELMYERCKRVVQKQTVSALRKLCWDLTRKGQNDYSLYNVEIQMNPDFDPMSLYQTLLDCSGRED